MLRFYSHTLWVHGVSGIRLLGPFLMALLCQDVEAKAFLLEGERLTAGEYLTSENGKFRMGLNSAGELEIVDTNPDPNNQNLVEDWDGKTYWAARFTPDGFPDRRPETHYFPPAEPYQNRPEYWQTRLSCCHGDFMHKQKRLGDKSSYKVAGGYFVSLKEGGDFHHLALYSNDKIWRTEKNIELWTASAGYPLDEIMLYLENCGRAVVFSVDKLIWCSCPYCEDWDGGKNQIFKPDFYNFHGTKFAASGIDPLGIPTHAKVNREGAGGATTVVGSAYSGVRLCGEGKSGALGKAVESWKTLFMRGKAAR